MGVCPICFDGLKSPCCCVPCGHVFCTACIRRWQNRPPSRTVLGNTIRESNCPQCRADIQYTQKIRFDEADSPEDEEIEADPWEATDDYSVILKSMYNIWTQSELKKLCVTAQNKLSSVPHIQRFGSMSSKCARGVQGFVMELRQVQGGPEFQIEWLKNKAFNAYQHAQNQVVNSHTVQSLQTQWSNLSDDRKRVFLILLIILAVIIMADSQNPTGFLPSVLLPIIHAVLSIISEVLFMLRFCLLRPLLCSFQCLLEIVLMFLDIAIHVVKAPLAILEILICLPYSVLSGLIAFLSNALNVMLRTLVPIGLLVYFISPTLQERIRNMFTHLQQN